jgi:hypothetical protein
MLENMSAGRSDVAARSPRVRSRVTNGNALLPNVDGRSTWARRARDVLQAHIADLGGDSNVSEAERSVVKRAAILTAELERLESAFAVTDGAPSIADLDAYQRASNSLRRLLESVGLRRRARDVTPKLDLRSIGEGA